MDESGARMQMHCRAPPRLVLSVASYARSVPGCSSQIGFAEASQEKVPLVRRPACS